MQESGNIKEYSDYEELMKVAASFNEEVESCIDKSLDELKSRRNFCLGKADEYLNLAEQYKKMASKITEHLAADNSDRPKAVDVEEYPTGRSAKDVRFA
jgi:hypothetical protein